MTETTGWVYALEFFDNNHRKLSEFLKVDRSAVSHGKNDKTRISPKHISSIAKELMSRGIKLETSDFMRLLDE